MDYPFCFEAIEVFIVRCSANKDKMGNSINEGKIVIDMANKDKIDGWSNENNVGKISLMSGILEKDREKECNR